MSIDLICGIFKGTVLIRLTSTFRCCRTRETGYLRTLAFNGREADLFVGTPYPHQLCCNRGWAACAIATDAGVLRRTWLEWRRWPTSNLSCPCRRSTTRSRARWLKRRRTGFLVVNAQGEIRPRQSAHRKHVWLHALRASRRPVEIRRAQGTRQLHVRDRRALPARPGSAHHGQSVARSRAVTKTAQSSHSLCR